jgi:hypothetical protein
VFAVVGLLAALANATRPASEQVDVSLRRAASLVAAEPFDLLETRVTGAPAAWCRGSRLSSTDGGQYISICADGNSRA